MSPAGMNMQLLSSSFSSHTQILTRSFECCGIRYLVRRWYWIQCNAQFGKFYLTCNGISTTPCAVPFRISYSSFSPLSRSFHPSSGCCIRVYILLVWNSFRVIVCSCIWCGSVNNAGCKLMLIGYELVARGVNVSIGWKEFGVSVHVYGSIVANAGNLL